LKKLSPSAFFRGRFPLAILAGLVLASAFPKIGIAGFAWIAPGLILATAMGKRGAESFRIGYAAGLAHYLGSLYWLLNIPVSGFPIVGWIALALFLALFPAAWVWLTINSLPAPKLLSAGDAPAASHSPDWLMAAREISKLPWAQRMSWALRSAAAWVALEMILARIFGGFPWNLLGDSQYRIVPLIQFASFTGVYGVSFLIVWTSVSLLCGASAILGKPAQRSPWMAEIILPFVAGFVAIFYGFHQIALTQTPVPNREMKVALVQPGIPQTMIWNPTNDLLRFHDLLHLTEDAMTNQPDLVVWPEAALPGLLRYDAEFGDPISAVAHEHNAWMIIGADDAEATPTATNYFNASFLISPQGKLANSYRKRGLVIFGEYIPLERWLPFIKWFTPITGSYTAGTEPVQFDLSTTHSGDLPQKVQTSVLICFEDVFPHLARKSVEPDTDFLVNITNDGWFGEGAAQWQQAAAATFRTIENGLPLIRCANTGISCWIDANGRWRQVFAGKTGSVYGAGFMIGTVPLPAKHPPTFYNRHGDVFGWACVGFAALTLLVRIAQTRKARSRPVTNGAPSANP
jgi:apolipoprotein N-acyltransferase